MKKTSLVILVSAFIVSGCATQIYPLAGSIYSDGVKSPIAATSNEIGTKVGTATAQSILGISYGDASIQKAAQNGSITKVATVDYKVTNILGLYVEATTVVKGE